MFTCNSVVATGLLALQRKPVFRHICSIQCILATIYLGSNDTCFHLTEGIYICTLSYLTDSVILSYTGLRVPELNKPSFLWILVSQLIPPPYPLE